MQLRITSRRASALLFVALALAGLVLAGCGSSSSSKTATDSASATAPGGAGSGGGTGNTGSTGSTGSTTGPQGAGRFKALRECLQKNGVTLPTRPQGTRPPGAGGAPRGGFFGGPNGRSLPNGVSRQKFQEALKKCGARRLAGGTGFAGGRARLNSSAVRKSLASFATCMREHGVNLPAPNTSGKGPVFDTSGINTKSSTFQKAEEACRSKVRLPFPRAGTTGPPGAAGPPGATGPTETR